MYPGPSQPAGGSLQPISGRHCLFRYSLLGRGRLPHHRSRSGGLRHPQLAIPWIHGYRRLPSGSSGRCQEQRSINPSGITILLLGRFEETAFAAFLRRYFDWHSKRKRPENPLRGTRVFRLPPGALFLFLCPVNPTDWRRCTISPRKKGLGER